MTYKGIVRGKTIELEEQLPYPEGQPVSVSVEPLQAKPQLDLRTVIRQIMHEPPHLSWEIKVTHLDYGQFHDYVINSFLYPLHDFLHKIRIASPLFF